VYVLLVFARGFAFPYAVGICGDGFLLAAKGEGAASAHASSNMRELTTHATPTSVCRRPAQPSAVRRCHPL